MCIRDSFRSSLTRVFNDYGRSHGLLKDKDENLSGADVREGLICVCLLYTSRCV